MTEGTAADGPSSWRPPPDPGLVKDLAALRDDPALTACSGALADLHEAVLRGTDAAAWAHVDLALVFPDESVVDSDREADSRRLAGAEFCRNVSVLLPLLITWVGIATATRAYGNLLEADPSAGQRPFIQLWEQRFDGEAPWYVVPFSVIGVLDILAIAGVILLSVWVGVLRRRLDVEIPRREAALQDALRRTVSRASVFLTKASRSSPDQFGASLNGVADRLEAIEERVLRVAGAAIDTLSSTEAIHQGAQEIAERITTAASAIGDGLRAAERGLDGAAGRLEGVVSSEAELTAQVRAGLEGVKDAANEMTKGATTMHDAADVLKGEVVDGASAATQLADASGLAHDAMTKLSNDVRGLSVMAKELEKTDGHMRRVVQSITDAGTTMGDQVKQLAEIHELLVDVADLLRDRPVAAGTGGDPSTTPPGLRRALDDQQATLTEIAANVSSEAITRAYVAALQQDRHARRWSSRIRSRRTASR